MKILLKIPCLPDCVNVFQRSIFTGSLTNFSYSIIIKRFLIFFFAGYQGTDDYKERVLFMRRGGLYRIIITGGIVLPVIVFFLLSCFLPRAFSTEKDFLEKGIAQYKEENYEEAIGILKKAREENPDSSTAAYYLGLAYKQTIDYPDAAVQLRDAANLQPRIKEAVFELIEILFRLNQLEEAKKWIEKAEKEDIFPAKTAYLKGLVLRKEGKNLEAVESFEKAKSLDKGLSQPAEFQIALCYAAQGKYNDAKKKLETSIMLNPQTGLAEYARLYKDLVEERRYLERPLRFTLGAFGQYDTNLVLKPVDPSSVENISDKRAWALLTSMRVDYIPKLEGPWLFNISNTFSQAIHNEHTHTHDYFADTVSAVMGYSFGRVALNVAGN
jgi:tetratricopeptide (TPR) repeat protein